MPPRFLTVAIVAFWLATAGWFFARDLYPRYFASDRPPFSINLDEESKSPPLAGHWIQHRHGKEIERVGSATTAWDLFINQETAGEVYTLVRARGDDDTYEVYTTQRLKNLRSMLRMVPLAEGMQGHANIDSMMRVTADGQLVELDTHTAIHITAPQAFRLDVHVAGRVEEGQFKAGGEVRGGFLHLDLKGEPVAMRASQGFFDPTRPWSRLYDLQEGKTWRVVYFNPAVDSLMQSLAGTVPGFGQQIHTPVIEGGVMTGTDNYFWDNREIPCQVIEYHGEGMTGKTFVRKSDGLVLRQEIEDQKTNLIMGLTRRPR